MNKLRRLLVPMGMVVAGVAIGGGTAAVTQKVMGSPDAPAPKAEESAFVPVKGVVAPLAFSDGRLAGYVTFDLSLEVSKDDAKRIEESAPLLLHAINMRTYKVPLASGPDGLLPDLAQFRRIVNAAALEAFGKGEIRRVAITQAVPAT